QPQGLAFTEDGLFVADTGNHLIRFIDLNTESVKTVAGNGELDIPRFGSFDALRVKLRSPWGLAIKGNNLYIAMAGTHQIWRFNMTNGNIEHYAGSGREGLRDGPLALARFSQPSGLSIAHKWLFVADAEDSAVRRIDLEQAQVETLTGTGLFDFGDRDGSFEEAALQHVLGVGAINAKRLVIADTYNHKIKQLDLEHRKITTLAGTGIPGRGKKPYQLNEPGGLAVLDDLILIADTNNHRIMKYDLKGRTMEEWRLRPDKTSVRE
ncbi:MAG: thiol-disulfide isomerase, partial [Ketobacter sp.]|nr:thiol-disulfide isomerase [Ketobacter sp.]